jgi:N-acetylglutamate synthase-like GNAT family acetyltransferase
MITLFYMVGYQVRRANVDDLAQLISLWQAVQLPIVDLERRVTEFQVIEKDGTLVAAIGLHIHQHDGLLHSEAFSDFGLAEALRPLLWERVEKVATNHGLFRIWTQETAPFWKRGVFHSAIKEQLDQRPKSFAERENQEWLVKQLRETTAAPINLDKEFERFKESERARTEEIMSQAKLLKGVATFLAIVLAVFSFFVLFKYVFFKTPPNRATPSLRQ